MTDDEIKALISTEIQKLQLSKEDAKGNAYYTATVNAWRAYPEFCVQRS